jgi:hypothetical protein
MVMMIKTIWKMMILIMLMRVRIRMKDKRKNLSYLSCAYFKLCTLARMMHKLNFLPIQNTILRFAPVNLYSKSDTYYKRLSTIWM